MPQTIAEQTRRVRHIQALTIAWMVAESLLSVAAAWMARSPALLAFAGDSAIELLSAVVVLLRFRSSAEHAERWAGRVTGSLLFLLAAFVGLSSALTLLGHNEPQPSLIGIAVLFAAALFMPLLAREKRLLAEETDSIALRADAAESALCGYLSIIALVGLLLNSVWHIRWADPVAGLFIIPWVLREGWESMRGKSCRCV